MPLTNPLTDERLGWSLTPAEGPSASHSMAPIVRKLAGVSVLEQRVGRCRAERMGTPDVDGRDSKLVVVYFLQGHEVVAGEAGQIRVQAGDIGVFHSSHDVAFEVVEPVRKLSFIFDANEVAGALPTLPQLCCLHLPRSAPMGKAVSGFFQGLADSLDAIPTRYEEAMMEGAISLVSKALAHDQTSLARGPSEVLTARLMNQVERTLLDRTLSAESLAFTNGVSVRYVHLLFSRKGLSVASWIRRRRLERCRDALQEATDNVKVADIGRRWGFDDPAHFSRAFRREFGISPTQVRRSAPGPKA